jgi:hypothetical protein
VFVTGIGSSTTYPDYKPAPFIVASQAEGVDLVTVVTEGIFSYCSLKVKIDTDRWLGPEQANVRCKGEVVGHVTTIEYGSQMLSLGGVHHLTGGSKKEGRVTCEMMEALGNKQAVEFTIDGGAQVVIQAGKAPIVNGVEEQRMRVGCGSATVGIFAKQFFGHADEVVVVDDHITGVLTQHQAGRCLSMRPSGIRIRGRKSTPGRYFQVANPGTGWGGTDIADPMSIVEGWDPETAWPGLKLLMVSTTGEHAAWFELDQQLVPRPCPCRRRWPHRGAHRRQLRAVAVHRAVPGRRRRQPARRRHREPGAAHPRHQAGAGQRHLRRRAGLRVAGRRHHGHGRRHAHARPQLRHRAHAGHRGAHRVQHAAGRLRGPGRPHGLRALAGRRAGARRLAQRRRAHRLLRTPVGNDCPLRGRIARRMWAAVHPFSEVFITPMAAVAGAVADEIIECYRHEGISRAAVNNGGDIALHLAPGSAFNIGVFSDLAAFTPWQSAGTVDCDAHLSLSNSLPVRGIATSGWRGRSFSLGIADSVTVLASTAAEADAAATIVANAVNVRNEGIVRRPACELKGRFGPAGPAGDDRRAGLVGR